MDDLKLLLDMEISLDAVVPHKEAVLALAADRLADEAGTSYQHAKAALAGREKLGSTALGGGVAMPHAMSRHCPRPAAALITLSCPVDFDTPDDTDVDVVFALIWPQDRAQDFVKLSGTVSRLLVHPALLRLVRKTEDPDLIRRSIFFNAQADRKSRPEPVDHDGGVIEFSSPPRDHGIGQTIAPAPVRRGGYGG